ncbi:hypothetical protein ACFLRT_05940, partial [Acidobacteriota bacterium]
PCEKKGNEMTTMLSLILAFMLSIGGSPAASVNPAGCPGNTGIQAPIDNNPNINRFFEDYNQKTASRAVSKKIQEIPLIKQPKTQIRLRFSLYLKEELRLVGYIDSMNLYQAFGMNPVNNRDPFGELTYKEFEDIKATDMIVRGYSADEILELINRGTFKRGYLAKVDLWNEYYIEDSFTPYEDPEYNAWGRQVSLWIQDKASVAKDFWASQDSVITHTIGATLSDFGGGSGHVFNLGTRSGDAIIDYQRSKDFETFLIMGVTIWGESGEAYLMTMGGHSLYKNLKRKWSLSKANKTVGKFKNQPGYMQDPISGRWKKIKNEPQITSKPLHGNRLDAPGAHDVYAVIEQKTGELLRFGETGRGYLVRAREWINYFQKKGIDVVLKRLKTVSGKGAAKLLETRYIETYKKIFGKLPKYQKNFH